MQAEVKAGDGISPADAMARQLQMQRLTSAPNATAFGAKIEQAVFKTILY